MAEDEAAAPLTGLYLFGVVRSRHRRRSDPATPPGGEPLLRVRFRELEALVRPAPYALAELDESALQEHQRIVDAVLRKVTILPLPPGMVFQGRRAILRFLEDQYIVLDEGLSFLDDHWEIRLHILGDDEVGEVRNAASRLYSDLRRFARAAIPLPTVDGRVLSAAFLVERSGWVRFVEHSEDLNRAHPELVFDITGPWPPYDFVTVRR
jgi:hypothetical protein